VERAKKQFLSPRFKAPNVFEVECDLEVLARCDPMIAPIRAAAAVAGKGAVSAGPLRLFKTGPSDWSSDIAWISQDDRESYDWFKALFDDLGLAAQVERHVTFDKAIVLYSGFFVTRSQCQSPHFHFDWIGGNNDAFTLVTPLTEHAGHFDLIYRQFDGCQGAYPYRLGKGLLFGDWFEHSTSVDNTGEQEVLLSMSFGTDRMENWPAISKTAAQQGRTHVQPDGLFVSRAAGGAKSQITEN
jgi:hypothetical protein